jgi:hypothetical protein
MNAEPHLFQVGRLPLRTWSISRVRKRKKKNGNQTLKFFIIPRFLFFFHYVSLVEIGRTHKRVV